MKLTHIQPSVNQVTASFRSPEFGIIPRFNQPSVLLPRKNLNAKKELETNPTSMCESLCLGKKVALHKQVFWHNLIYLKIQFVRKKHNIIRDTLLEPHHTSMVCTWQKDKGQGIFGVRWKRCNDFCLLCACWPHPSCHKLLKTWKWLAKTSRFVGIF